MAETEKCGRLYVVDITYSDEDIRREELLYFALELACEDRERQGEEPEPAYYIGRAYERYCARRTYEDADGKSWSVTGDRPIHTEGQVEDDG